MFLNTSYHNNTMSMHTIRTPNRTKKDIRTQHVKPRDKEPRKKKSRMFRYVVPLVTTLAIVSSCLFKPKLFDAEAKSKTGIENTEKNSEGRQRLNSAQISIWRNAFANLAEARAKKQTAKDPEDKDPLDLANCLLDAEMQEKDSIENIDELDLDFDMFDKYNFLKDEGCLAREDLLSLIRKNPTDPAAMEALRMLLEDKDFAFSAADALEDELPTDRMFDPNISPFLVALELAADGNEQAFDILTDEWNKSIDALKYDMENGTSIRYSDDSFNLMMTTIFHFSLSEPQSEFDLKQRRTLAAVTDDALEGIVEGAGCKIFRAEGEDVPEIVGGFLMSVQNWAVRTGC